MKFSRPELAHQFAVLLHEKTRDLAERFDRYTAKKGYPEAIVTSISRDVDFYENNGLKTPRFSWHLVDAAVDFRNRHYKESQRLRCEQWLREQCKGPEWELVVITHGTGPHFHVAYRAFDRRKDWETRFKEHVA